MTKTEELIAKCQAGDSEAKEALIVENSGLIWSVAKRFLGRGTEADDVYQLACLGFLKAVEGFDLAYGTQFSTYAVPKISGEIRRFLRDDGAVIVFIIFRIIHISLSFPSILLQSTQCYLLVDLYQEHLPSCKV